MASLDIAKIVLSAEGKNIPDSYRDTLRALGLNYFDEAFAAAFSDFAELRNLLAQEYLDFRWKHIQQFIKEIPNVYPRFLPRMKEITK